MKVLVIGANGKIGRMLCEKLSASVAYQPSAFIRNEAQRAFFEKMDIPVVLASLEDTETNIGQLLRGFEAIVFTAGSGGKTGYDKTLEIDLDGAVKVINAAVQNGVKRFVMVSAAHADDRAYWDQSSIKPYFIAKHFADKALTQSKLDYTILRPVGLTDDEQAGTVKMSTNADGLNPRIPRVAVADTILAILNDETTYRKIIEMSSGDDAIDNAVRKVCSE